MSETGKLTATEVWVQAADDELPTSFRDPECDNFRCICSNGFEGPLSLSSAFLHKPSSWPQCFPLGPDGDATCTSEIVRITTIAGRAALEASDHA